MDIFDEKIIGYDAVKETLYRILDALKRPDEYKKKGISMPHGLLLTGVPGTGKSTLAECFLKESGRYSVIFRKDSEQNEFLSEMKGAFEQAAEQAPSVILLEDIHSYAASQFASEWAGLQAAIDHCKTADVFVIATANMTENIPESLKRPGRFDYIIEVGLPKGRTAEKIIAAYLQSEKLGDDINIEDIAKVLDGYSCATLESAINTAKANAAYDNSEMICRRHIVPALMEIVHKMRRTDIDYSDADWRYIATHEAGHAAVCEVLHPGQTAFISILSQGDSVAGKTAYAYWGYSTEQELMDLVTVSLAGKAAVEILLGEADVGSAQDIQNAVKLLAMWYIDCAGGGFSAVENENRRTSESGLQGQERMITIKLEELYQRAKRIIFDNRDFVSALSDAVLRDESGTLLSSDIKKIQNSLNHG